MAQPSSITAIRFGIGKAAVALARRCSPRARAVRQRLREIAASGPAVSAIGAAWAADRQPETACTPRALAA